MRPPEILVVDDDLDFAESLALVLEAQGSRVELAHTAEEAIAQFSKRRFDIAFLDVRLPAKNGVQGFLEIRQIQPDARIVMMSGHAVEGLLEKASRQGAWGVLHKPFEVELAVRLVDELGRSGLLIVDDDPDFVTSLREFLESQGKQVLTCLNGREALERARCEAISLLILDLRMPMMNGLETVRELRRLGNRVPVILLTAFADEEADLMADLAEGAVRAILRKPVDPNLLLRTIEEIH